jgi:ketosteroid isomerase-like protein
MRRVVVAALFVFLAAATLYPASGDVAALKKADQDWSKAAQSANIDQFMSFVGDDVYQCGPDGKWNKGKATVREEWSKMLADSSFKLSWTLDSADLSKDGSLGYTRGSFQGSQGGKPFSGSYATVWKKGKDGKWLVAVDIASAAQSQ